MREGETQGEEVVSAAEVCSAGGGHGHVRLCLFSSSSLHFYASSLPFFCLFPAPSLPLPCPFPAPSLPLPCLFLALFSASYLGGDHAHGTTGGPVTTATSFALF